jgi:hypothetical protein
MEIIYSPECTNKNCMGGVITYDGQTGKQCKLCLFFHGRSLKKLISNFKNQTHVYRTGKNQGSI